MKSLTQFLKESFISDSESAPEIVTKHLGLKYATGEGNSEEPYTITKKEDMYVVDGPAIRELMRKVNMEDNESLYYFQKKLNELGVNDKLREAGVKEGDTVKVFDYLLEWED